MAAVWYNGIDGRRGTIRFDIAMSKMCKNCQSRAAHHRMTTTGTLYCLALNSRGQKMRDAQIYRGDHWDSAMIWHLPVKYLTKATFDKKVGQSIQLGLTTTLKENDGTV